jgi:predicted Zn-dependent peptidase
VDEDNPDYLVHEIFVQNFWKDHPLGKPILGTRETVKKFQQSTLFDYYGGRFFGGNIVFSAAGNLDHAKFVDMVSEKFAGLQAGQDDWATGAAPKTRAKIIMRNKKALEQVQICIGVPAPPIAAEERYTSYILNSILGGGMSSRLFQVVREEHGLAYSIFSELNPYRDTGSLCVYAGTSIDKASRVVDLIVTEFGRMKKEAISAEELRRAQDQIKGNMVLGLESSSARMSNLARQEMYFDQFFGTDEILEKIEQVTIESVQEMATQIFRPEAVALTVLGNLKDLKITRDQLAC